MTHTTPGITHHMACVTNLPCIPMYNNACRHIDISDYIHGPTCTYTFDTCKYIVYTKSCIHAMYAYTHVHKLCTGYMLMCADSHDTHLPHCHTKHTPMYNIGRCGMHHVAPCTYCNHSGLYACRFTFIYNAFI